MTTSDYLNQLEQDREDLIDNLETQGITGLSGDETFTELVPEVLNIQSGGDISDYFNTELTTNTMETNGNTIFSKLIKRLPNITIGSGVTSLSAAFEQFKGTQLPTITGIGNITNFERTFSYCSNMTSFPLIDTSSGTNFSSMFSNCISLTSVPKINTSSGTNFSSMFSGCDAITTIPLIDTSKGTNFSSMFESCDNLTTIPQLDTSSCNNFYNVFKSCVKLETVPELNMSNAARIDSVFNNATRLKDFGGFTNLGQSYLTSRAANYSQYTLSLSNSSQITYASLMNVINKLYDIATSGCNTQKLVLGSTNLAKLDATDIAIATNKGWTVSAS